MCDDPFEKMIFEYKNSLENVRKIIAKKKKILEETSQQSPKAYCIKSDIVSYKLIERDLYSTINILENYYQKGKKNYVKKPIFNKN